MRLRELLFEADRYRPMFAALLAANPRLQHMVDEEINFARTTLKREDRIIWYLRWFRVTLLAADKQVAAANAISRPEIVPGAPRPDALAAERTQLERWVGVKRELIHLMSLPFPEIQQYRFDRQSPSTLLKELDVIERAAWERDKAEEEGRRRNVSIQAGDRIIEQFPDGFAWWLLNRGGCSDEARAMGHCGNGAGREGERIISLRQPIRSGTKTYWQPSLTFILDANGLLGEMKGRGNDKPAARYHQYIAKLLENPLVKGIKGGGYLPQKNFMLSDMPQAEQDRLVGVKPNLGGLKYMLQKFGPTAEVAQQVMAKLADIDTESITGFPKWDEKRKLILLNQYPSIDDFVERYGSDFLKRMVGSQRGSGDNPFHDTEYHVESYEVETLFDKLPDYVQANIIAYAKAGYVESYSEEDFDTGSQAMSILWDERDDIIGDFKSAVITGLQYGAESDCYDDIVKALNNAENDYGVSVEYTKHTDKESGRTGFVWDSPCWLVIDLAKAIEICEDEGLADEISSTGWFPEKIEVEEPYNGWSGYDESAALETILDMLPSELTKKPEPKKVVRRKGLAKPKATPRRNS